MERAKKHPPAEGQGYKHTSGRKPVLPKESEAELAKLKGDPVACLAVHTGKQLSWIFRKKKKKRGLSSTGSKMLCAKILNSAKGNRKQEQQGLTPQQLRNGSSSIKISLLSWESRMFLPTSGIAMRQECRTIFCQPL